MALSMRERLTLQKSVKQSLATLRGGEVGMRERMALQKQVKADMTKLGGQTEAPTAPQDSAQYSEYLAWIQDAERTRAELEGDGFWREINADERLNDGEAGRLLTEVQKRLEGLSEPAMQSVTSDNTSVGDTVEWRNEMGTISGNFRGITDDGRHAVIVADGMQMSAPVGEVFKASEEVAQEEPPAHERITAAIQGGDANEAMRIARTLTEKLALSEALVKAGFSIVGGSVAAILADVWPAMQKKARETTAGGEAPETSEPQSTATRLPTLTAQAARGDFNDLALPEFIEKLKAAYSADEDLDGAKEAALGYLEANQQELEAA
ncbi:hypothetical protein ACT3R7_11995 [Halomonas sp. AOP43-A1-21]